MKNYDKYQKQAIMSLENTLLIAGPGSGKTHTIVGKIDYLIDNNIYKRDDILVISFTNESVDEINKRLKKNVDVMTFHKLSMNILGKNIKVGNNYDLYFIINEYLNSYILYTKKRSYILKNIYKINSEKEFINYIISFINIYKNNYNDSKKLFELYDKSYFLNKEIIKIIIEIYIIYENELSSKNEISVNDLIKKANEKVINDHYKVKYKFIIIDEFQDTSSNKLELINNIISNNGAKLFAVGDDSQSIYKFSGANLNGFLNLQKHYNVIYLKNNYRNNEYQIKAANNFIFKNKKQIKKSVNTFNTINKPIIVVFYNDKEKVLENIISTIEDDYLVLGRYNYDEKSFKVKENFLTIHKSKGLEASNIIVVNLYNKKNSFPSKRRYSYLIGKLIDDDYVHHEEERRLFYVALTRAKYYTYLVVSYKSQSSFVREIIKDNKNIIKFIYL